MPKNIKIIRNTFYLSEIRILNIDIVLPTTETLENWYYDLWREVISLRRSYEKALDRGSSMPIVILYGDHAAMTALLN